jgi:hypothetical protein
MRDVQRGTMATPIPADTRFTIVCFSSAMADPRREARVGEELHREVVTMRPQSALGHDDDVTRAVCGRIQG